VKPKRCTATHPTAWLQGAPVRCELVLGHESSHAHLYAARYWNDQPPQGAPGPAEGSRLVGSDRDGGWAGPWPHDEQENTGAEG